MVLVMSRRRPPKHPLDHEPRALALAFEKSDKTQAQAAEALGCSISLVSEMVKGTRNATPERLDALAAFFGCPRWVLEAPQKVTQ